LSFTIYGFANRVEDFRYAASTLADLFYLPSRRKDCGSCFRLSRHYSVLKVLTGAARTHRTRAAFPRSCAVQHL